MMDLRRHEGREDRLALALVAALLLLVALLGAVVERADPPVEESHGEIRTAAPEAGEDGAGRV
jgi:hypothetical protein